MKCVESSRGVVTFFLLHAIGRSLAFMGSKYNFNPRLNQLVSNTPSPFWMPPSSSSPSSSCLFVEPLAKEGDWAAYLDEENTGLVYYFNGATGESLWVPPTKTFPVVSLNPSQKILAQEKQREYNANISSNDNASSQKLTSSGSTLTGFPGQDKEDKTVETEGGGPFGFFNRKKKEPDMQQGSSSPVEEPFLETKKRRFGLGVIKSVLSRVGQETSNNNASGTPGVMKSATTTTTSSISESSTGSAFSTPFTTTTTPTISPTTSDKSFSILDIDVAAYVLPHPAKVRWGGEDAVFIKGRTFGVFDGVSGAEKLDGVPLYSLTLAKEMKSLVNKNDSLSLQDITKALTVAAEYADKSATGASTAVVGSLNDDGELTILNLGDSFCMIIRDGKMVAKTKEIVHYFDCPFQLSEDSPDRPKDGTKLITKVQKGDIIVMGSDGVFDNLKESEICDLCINNSKLRAATLSRKIVEQSRRVSLDSKADTPYAQLAMRNKIPDYSSGLGGKVDDVSCVVVKC